MPGTEEILTTHLFHSLKWSMENCHYHWPYPEAKKLRTDYNTSEKGLAYHPRKHGTTISLSLEYKDWARTEGTKCQWEHWYPTSFDTNKPLGLFTWLRSGLTGSCFWPHFYWLSEFRKGQASLHRPWHTPELSLFGTIELLLNVVCAVVSQTYKTWSWAVLDRGIWFWSAPISFISTGRRATAWKECVNHWPLRIQLTTWYMLNLNSRPKKVITLNKVLKSHKSWHIK